MASLNLIPNPTVLGVQAAIFLANIVVVKKLFVDPYLSVLDRRAKLTTGSKDDAGRFLADAEALSQKINARMEQSLEKATKERAVMRDAAIAKRETLLSAAEKAAKSDIETVERQVQSDLAAEKSKIPAVVAQLTDEVYRVALA